MSKRVFSFVLVVAMLATVIAPAFAQTPEPSAPAAGTAMTTTVPMAPAVPITKTDTAGKTLRIVYIPKNTGNPYFDSIINGFKKAADELGLRVHDRRPVDGGRHGPDSVHQRADAARRGCHRHFAGRSRLRSCRPCSRR